MVGLETDLELVGAESVSAVVQPEVTEVVEPAADPQRFTIGYREHGEGEPLSTAAVDRIAVSMVLRESAVPQLVESGIAALTPLLEDDSVGPALRGIFHARAAEIYDEQVIAAKAAEAARQQRLAELALERARVAAQEDAAALRIDEALGAVTAHLLREGAE